MRSAPTKNPAFVTAGGPLDADTLDGMDSTAFLPADGKADTAGAGVPVAIVNVNGSGWVNDAVVCTSLSCDPVTIVTGEYDGTIRVNSYDDTGVKVTDNFICVVYELGS